MTAYHSAADARSLHSQAEWPRTACSPLWSCFSEYNLHPGSHAVVMVNDPCAGSHEKYGTWYKVSDPVIVPALIETHSFPTPSPNSAPAQSHSHFSSPPLPPTPITTPTPSTMEHQVKTASWHQKEVVM